MDHFELCCARLHELTRIPLALCDSQGRYLAAWPAMPPDTILPQVAAYLPQDFLLQGRDALHPLIFYQEPGFFTGVAQLGPGIYCLAGPSSALQHSRPEVLAFCAPAVSSHRLQEYCSLLMAAPLTTLPQMRALLCLLVQLVHGAAIAQEAVLFCDNTSLAPLDSHALQRELFQNREALLPHVPADFETSICDAVAQGSLESLDRCLVVPSTGQNGKMSTSELRQAKYTFVGFITLVTRAAVRGGLPVETAYALSDIYCQRMDALETADAVNRLLYTAVMDFCQKVRTVREGSGRSAPVQKCLEYITLHLHEPLRLPELALQCGVCVRTLTTRFRREMGMSLTAYIHAERIREACYLLEHTGHSLSDIAFFLNYPSQSYFTQVFKRYRGCTPQQYRDYPSLGR